MGLGEALLRHQHPVFPCRLGASDGRLARTARELGALGLDTDPPPPAETLDAFAARMRGLLDSSGLAGLSERDWRLLPWALWHGEPCLAAEPRLLEALEQRLLARFRRRDVHALARAYLQEFSLDMPAGRRLAALLAGQVGMRGWPWAARHRAHALFDFEAAPGRLAAHVLHSHASIEEALALAGLEGRGQRGMALAALLEALRGFRERMRQGLASEMERDRLCTWALAEDGRIPAAVRPLLAEALLAPWTSGTPPSALREPIEQFVLRHYGDPRSRPRDWLGVSEDAKSVFKRWLVKLALDQFLDVIDRFALEQHWIYRRAFWMAYYRAGAIDEAHVMFGRRGYMEARRLFGRDVSCAELEGGRKPVAPEHAVLLMRIGRLVVADWSHNGRCVVWPEEVAWAPPFGHTRYSSSQVYPEEQRGDWACTHAGSPSYSWQRRVRDHIYARTRIWIGDRAFEVR